MSSKKNVLFISIVVMSIFVKMVPAPDDESDDSETKVTWKHLDTFKEMYKTEIHNYCEKHQITINPDQKDMSAAISYFKDFYDDFNRYNSLLTADPDLFITFLTLMSDEQTKDLEKELKTFKEVMSLDLKEIYESETFCPRPSEIEHDYVLEQARFLLNIKNAYKLSFGESPISVNEMFISFLNHATKYKEENSSEDKYVPYLNNHILEYIPVAIYVEFLQLYANDIQSYKKIRFHYDKDISSLETIMDAKIFLIDNYQHFKNKWSFYGFGINEYIQFLILQKKDTVKTSDVLDQFLQYFKESLDVNYYMVTWLDINKLSDEQKRFYYDKMLSASYNFYRAYNEKTSEATISQFVNLMIGVAPKILEANKTKKIPTSVVHQPESDGENDGVEVQINYYTCDFDGCELPNKVTFKDVLRYLIVKSQQ